MKKRSSDSSKNSRRVFSTEAEQLSRSLYLNALHVDSNRWATKHTQTHKHTMSTEEIAGLNVYAIQVQRRCSSITSTLIVVVPA